MVLCVPLRRSNFAVTLFTNRLNRSLSSRFLRTVVWSGLVPERLGSCPLHTFLARFFYKISYLRKRKKKNIKTNKKNIFFIAPLLKIRFSVPAKRNETAIFNPRGETLKVGLQTAVLTRSTGTENQILKTVAMKNSMHYSKQYTANANRVTAALASLGQQTSHSFAIAVFRPL